MEFLLELLQEERSKRKETEAKVAALEERMATLTHTINTQAARKQAQVIPRLFRQYKARNQVECDCNSNCNSNSDTGYDEPDRETTGHEATDLSNACSDWL